jgi:hypothetical protein
MAESVLTREVPRSAARTVVKSHGAVGEHSFLAEVRASRRSVMRVGGHDTACFPAPAL